MSLRDNLVREIDKFILSRRKEFEEDALGLLTNLNIAPTRENVTRGIQYLEGIKNLIKVRDIIKKEVQ